MKYVADTNVVSELMKPQVSDAVVDWFQDNEGNVFLTSITVKELYFGMLRLPDGKRKERLREAITGIVMDCARKTFSFDAYSGFICAQLHEQALSQGRVPTVEDLMIAAICKRNECALATRNVKDFDYLGVDVINPFNYDNSKRS